MQDISSDGMAHDKLLTEENNQQNNGPYHYIDY